MRLDVVGLRLVGNVELLQPLAFEAGQPGLELLVARRAEDGGDLPVFLADEALDLELAVADEPQRHRLHAAGRAGAGQLAPQHRRQREADEIVERAARQIGVDQRRVDLARIGHRVEHRLLGDGVEDDAADRLVLQHALALQHFEHMPGNGLALAIRVGGEDQPVGVLHRLGDVGQPLGRRAVDLPGHGEIVVGLHRAVLGRQVADMAEGGQNLVVAAEIFVDRLRLCRRFDDDDVHERLCFPCGARRKSARPEVLESSVTWLRFSVRSSAEAENRHHATRCNFCVRQKFLATTDKYATVNIYSRVALRSARKLRD